MRLWLAALCLAGCATGGASQPGRGDNLAYTPFDVAVYQHPVTGEVRHCEHTMGLFWWSGPLDYGACKDRLEADGFQRIPR